MDHETLLLEKNPTVGGGCRSIEDKGFTFDHAGHILFTKDPYVQELYTILLKDNIHWQDREAWIYSKNVYTRYPFQASQYGLPQKVIHECIKGAIETKLRHEKKAEALRPNEKPVQMTDCCADGTDLLPDFKGDDSQPACSLNTMEKKPENFEQFIYDVWGKGIAEHFAIPYNKKLWTIPLTEIETSWIEGRVPLPSIEEIVEGAFKPLPRPMGPNARFGYPLEGGFQALMLAFLPHIKGKIELNARVVRLSPKNKRITLSDGRTIVYDYLVSTIPLPELVNCMGDEAPPEVKKSAQELIKVSVRCVNLGVARENITDKHWIYYPEETLFHRVFVQGNASPKCNPPGGFGLVCEISYSPSKPLPCEGEELINRCIADCIRVGLLTAEDRFLAKNQVDIPYAYVVYDHGRSKNVACIKNWLKQYRIVLFGRYSEWEYYNSDHALLAGKKAAETVQALRDADIKELR